MVANLYFSNVSQVWVQKATREDVKIKESLKVLILPKKTKNSLISESIKIFGLDKNAHSKGFSYFDPLLFSLYDKDTLVFLKVYNKRQMPEWSRAVCRELVTWVCTAQCWAYSSGWKRSTSRRARWDRSIILIFIYSLYVL